MIFSYLLNMQSHPSWVCGLKLLKTIFLNDQCMSHPSWVCGLKPKRPPSNELATPSHPSWVCGLKHLAYVFYY